MLHTDEFNSRMETTTNLAFALGMEIKSLSELALTIPTPNGKTTPTDVPQKSTKLS